MPKFEIEFESVPAGYEPVAFRCPKAGESFITDAGTIIHSRHSGGNWLEPRIILRKAYEFPEFIPHGWWIAMDKSGLWCAYASEPEIDDCEWTRTHNCRDLICLEHHVWTPPEVTDWKKSKMQKVSR